VTKVALALAWLVAAPARADVLSEVKAHEAFFARACWEGDVPAVMTFFADDAVVIWPGAGAEAKGKTAIERLVTEFCTRRPAPPILRSVETIPLDETHVAATAHWEDTVTRRDGSRVTVHVRATQVLVRKSAGKWLYLLDHTSIGVPHGRPPRRERRAR
jgi:uncharacterized protein (TIGR02246 family)